MVSLSGGDVMEEVYQFLSIHYMHNLLYCLLLPVNVVHTTACLATIFVQDDLIPE